MGEAVKKFPWTEKQKTLSPLVKNSAIIFYIQMNRDNIEYTM